MEANKILTEETFLAFKKGSQKAFESVYHTYQPVISNYIFRFCGNREDTEEICHEAFVVLYLKRRHLRDAEGVYPYLFTVIKRLSISNLRKRVNERKYREYVKIHWQDRTDHTKESISAGELQRMHNRIVDELPDKQREVYLLSKRDQLSYKEIADLLGISINTVRNHLVVAGRQVKLRLTEFTMLVSAIYFFFLKH